MTRHHAKDPFRIRDHVVEFDDTEKIFTNPSDPRTEAYVTGRFG